MLSCSHCRWMPGAHVWRSHSGNYDLAAAARTVTVPQIQISGLTRIGTLHPTCVTPPRASVSNRTLRGSLGDLGHGMRDLDGHSGAATYLNPAFLSDQPDGAASSDDPQDSSRQAGASAAPTLAARRPLPSLPIDDATLIYAEITDSHPRAHYAERAPQDAIGSVYDEIEPLPHEARRVSHPPITPAPDSARPQGLPGEYDPLIGTLHAAWAETEELQSFYGAEFDHAQRRAGCHLARLRGPTLRHAFEANFEVLEMSSRNGTAIRMLRDTFSLAVSVPILVGVVMQIAAEAEAEGTLVMCAELIKAPLTTSLSYQTISRHHMVDEYLKRTELGMKLIDTVLSRVSLPGHAGHRGFVATRSTAHLCYQVGELARHASTLFTLVNYLVAPVRIGLVVPNETPIWRDNRPAWSDPVIGLLRLVSSTSDTLRAVLSQIGTHCRHELFGLRMRALLDRADHLQARVHALRNDPATREHVEPALEQTRILCAMSANDVIDYLMRDPRALTEALGSARGNDSARLRRRVGLNLGPFGMYLDPTTKPGHFHLLRKPPQNHWGMVAGTESNWWHKIQLPLRTTYRLTLMLQHWLAALLHRMTEPCEPAFERLTRR